MTPNPPKGYKAPRRHYTDIRNDVYDGTIGPGSLYLREGYTPTEEWLAKKVYDDTIDRVNRAENAGEIIEGTITLKRKSTDDGYQYRGILECRYVDGYGSITSETREGRWTTGSGPDEKSKAIANVISQSPQFDRLLMNVREKGKRIRHGYKGNSGMPFAPRIQDGTGVKEFISMMEDLGFTVMESDGPRGSQVIYFRRAIGFPSHCSKPVKGDAGKGRASTGKTRGKKRQSSSNAKGSRLMDIRELGTRTWYRAQNPATLARRLYGRNVHVREEHQTVYDPAYRIWTAVDDRGLVYGRLYTTETWWRGEDRDYDDDDDW